MHGRPGAGSPRPSGARDQHVGNGPAGAMVRAGSTTGCEQEDLHACEGPDHVQSWDAHIPPGRSAARGAVHRPTEGAGARSTRASTGSARAGRWTWIFERSRAAPNAASTAGRLHRRHLHERPGAQGGGARAAQRASSCIAPSPVHARLRLRTVDPAERHDAGAVGERCRPDSAPPVRFHALGLAIVLRRRGRSPSART